MTQAPIELLVSGRAEARPSVRYTPAMTRYLPHWILLTMVGCAPAPYAELEQAGVAEYVGQAVVSDQTSVDGVETYTFDRSSGPRCLRDTDFTVSVRDKSSDTLLIFLQGGGACWSDFCLAVEVAGDGIPNRLEALDDTLDHNPFRDFDLVYVPYCDGSLFSGDTAIDDDGDGQPDRHQFGLRNLSAALDVAVEQFPDPERIVLAGSSGGGYGTILGAVLVRLMWPDVPIDVVSDSGSGVARGAVEPTFVADLVAEWNAERFLPESCPDCIADGHLTPFVGWQLSQDPDLRVSLFSSYEDSVISRVFLALDPLDFERDLREQTAALQQAWPDRYSAFLIEGEAHTTLLGDVSGFLGEDFELADAIAGMVTLNGMQESQVDGTDFATWINWMFDGDERWGPLAE